MRYDEIKTLGLIFLLCMASGGCAMSNLLLMKAPFASASIEAPRRIVVEDVFLCAEKSVSELTRTNEFWVADITRRNLAIGVLETGDFDEENKSGFRVKVSFVDRKGKIEVALKGAGPYFIDLGVDDAIAKFKEKMQNCLHNR